MEQPGRPLGLSIAIAVGSLIHGILPIAQALFYLSLLQHFQQIEFLEEGGAIGGGISNVSLAELLLPLFFGLVLVILAVFAWRGRPPAGRWVFMLAIVAMTIYTTLTVLSALITPPSLDQGIDSATGDSQPRLILSLIINWLITLYIVWYMNRGPARAFYRRYYLSEHDS